MPGVSNPNEVHFWFEFASTYSYPAALRIEQQARAAGCTLRYRPFLLGPIFKQQGWNDSPFNIYPAKGRYMWRDLERVCAQLGIPFARPTRFPRNGLLAARVACGLGPTGVGEFVARVYSANFAQDKDISDSQVLMGCLKGVVDDAQQALSFAASEQAKAELRKNTEEAIARGIFGAPSFTVGDELFWGNDRLESALAHAGG